MKKISQEVKDLSKLNHPTIQRFIGFSFVDFNFQKKPVIISELFDRLTQFDVLENERKRKSNPLWNSTKKLIVIYGIAYGMHLLHLHNLFHPNLNTKNILIDRKSFHPKLSEIGFYTQLQNTKNAKSRTSSHINFLRYNLAPEILESKSQTSKSDVYSFAMIVYEIITNEIPFTKLGKPVLIYSKIVNENFRPPFNQQIQYSYQQLIEKCWLQNPDERPSFSEIIDQLENDTNFISKDINKEEFYNYVKYIKSI